MWNCDAPTKALVLAWQLLKDIWATKENLKKRGVIDHVRETSCVFCFEESSPHLFVRCRRSKEGSMAEGIQLDGHSYATLAPPSTTLYRVWPKHEGQKIKETGTFSMDRHTTWAL